VFGAEQCSLVTECQAVTDCQWHTSCTWQNVKRHDRLSTLYWQIVNDMNTCSVCATLLNSVHYWTNVHHWTALDSLTCVIGSCAAG